MESAEDVDGVALGGGDDLLLDVLVDRTAGVKGREGQLCTGTA